MENIAEPELPTEKPEQELVFPKNPQFTPQPKLTRQIWIIGILVALFLIVVASNHYFENKKTRSSDEKTSQTDPNQPLILDMDQPILNTDGTTTESPAPSAFSEEAATKPSCTTVDESLSQYTFCKTADSHNYITGPNNLMIKYVETYSVSPNKKTVFVIRDSDDYAAHGGAPTENALSRIDSTNGKVTELFSQIYFPSFTDQSWSESGKAFVFTAEGGSTNPKTPQSNMYAVFYCTTSCKILAIDAGPAGIGGNPAYFEGNTIRYTGMDEAETLKSIPAPKE